ncbi:MAG: RidA family protein [Dehalococcoidia bacterium]|nr:RidA family protein [Dehalococcoidia bacterium]
MPLTHINPASLHRNPAFSQGVLIEGAGALLVVGGQNGVDAEGNIVSPELGAQTEQALRNVLALLAEVGATQEHVAKMTIYAAVGSDITEGYAASQRVWGPHPTAITVLLVPAFARPGILVEIDALAQVPSAAP